MMYSCFLGKFTCIVNNKHLDNTIDHGMAWAKGKTYFLSTVFNMLKLSRKKCCFLNIHQNVDPSLQRDRAACVLLLFAETDVPLEQLFVRPTDHIHLKTQHWRSNPASMQAGQSFNHWARMKMGKLLSFGTVRKTIQDKVASADESWLKYPKIR